MCMRAARARSWLESVKSKQNLQSFFSHFADCIKGKVAADVTIFLAYTVLCENLEPPLISLHML